MSITATAGVGLRPPHYQYVLAEKPQIPWFEVHSENYFGAGGLPHFYLEQIAAEYPLSFHGVGMSLGSADELDQSHLKRLKQLIDKYQPSLVSEHLSFSSIGNRHFNDLLPITYTEASFTNFCTKVEQVQDFLGRQILIENPSSYLRFEASTISEWQFYAELPSRTKCGLLLDLNNVFVSCNNFGYDSEQYLAAINPDDVREYHLAGHKEKQFPEGKILIDDHGSKVSEPVWQLFKQAVKLIGVKPTLVEWDTNLPEFQVLQNECDYAQQVLLDQC